MPPPEKNQTTAELLAGYTCTLVELCRRGVVRSNNAPAGDYAEWLTARGLGGTLAGKSAMSYDVTLATGHRVQVKARIVSEPPTRGQLQTSPFRSWEFEVAAFVLLRDTDYEVLRASLIPVQIVRDQARRSAHVQGDIIQMNSKLLDHPRAEDITERLRAAARVAD